MSSPFRSCTKCGARVMASGPHTECQRCRPKPVQIRKPPTEEQREAYRERKRKIRSAHGLMPGWEDC